MFQLVKSASALALSASVLVSLTAVGETYRLAYSEASKSNNCWGDVNQWTTDGKDTGTSPTAFNATDEFIVPAWSGGYTLRTPASGSQDAYWYGKCLRLGGEYKNQSNIAVIRHETRSGDDGDVAVIYENDGLILDSRSRYYPYYGNQTCRIKGHVTVASTLEDRPAEIFSGNGNNVKLRILDDFSGAAGTYATIVSKKTGFLVSLADSTAFYGSLKMTNGVDGADSRLVLSTVFPGNLYVGETAVVETPANGSIASLTLEAGAKIDATAGAFSVTTSFVHDGPVTIVVSPRAGNEDWQPLVSFPKDSGVTEADLRFVLADGSPFVCDELRVESTETALVASAWVAPVVTLLVADNVSRTKDGASAFTNPAQWSDNDWPTNQFKAYLCTKSLRTADSSADVKTPQDDFVFAGYSLTMDDGATLFVNNRSFAARKLVLRDGATLGPSVYCNGSIYAPIEVGPGVGNFQPFIKTWTLTGEISGSGDLVLTGVNGATSSQPYGTVVLIGTNTAFTGTMRVTIPAYMPPDPVTDKNKITPRFDRNYMTLYLTDKRNLGGALPALNRRAFTLENMSVLGLTNGVTSLTLDDPTRGVFVNSCARFRLLAGETLTIASPLAVQGTIWKEGAGRLVLANPSPTFGTDAEQSEPDAMAENHTLMLHAGDVEIASADALNGINVVVSNATARLVLDVASTDADLRTYGIRNLKTGYPFHPDGDLSKVTLALTASTPPAEDLTVAVATVQEGALGDELDVVVDASLRGWRVKEIVRESLTIDNIPCETIKARVVRAGTVFLLR